MKIKKIILSVVLIVLTLPIFQMREIGNYGSLLAARNSKVVKLGGLYTEEDIRFRYHDENYRNRRYLDNDRFYRYINYPIRYRYSYNDPIRYRYTYKYGYPNYNFTCDVAGNCYYFDNSTYPYYDGYTARFLF